MIENGISEKVGEFTRHIYFTTAYDRVHEDPKKNYGIGAVHMICALEGEEGVVTLDFFTDWYLKKNQPGVDKYNADGRGLPVLNRLGGLDVHSKVPFYEGQTKVEHCQWIEGGCYCDGTALGGGQLLEEFIEFGLDHIWPKMEEYYQMHLKEVESGST